MNASPPIRRFEPGASAYLCDDFMRSRGFRVSALGAGAFMVRWPSGRQKRLRIKQLITLVDKERAAAGLQPIRSQK